MADGYIPDWFAGLDRVLAMEWDRMIPGHPGPGGRLGTKDDVRAFKEYMVDLSNAAKQLATDRKCLNDEAMRAVKLPKYEGWGGYGTVPVRQPRALLRVLEPGHLEASG